MTEIIVRDAVPADYEAMAGVYRSCHPALLVSAASIAHAASTYASDGLTEFVAELDGVVVGNGSVWPNSWSGQEGAVQMDISVLPGSRRRGAGSALLAALERRYAELGGRVALGNVEEGDGLAFVGKRGFTTGRVARVSRCVLTRIPAETAAPEGVRVVRLSELDDLRGLYESDTLAAADIPSDSPIVPYGFEIWKSRLLDDPRLDHDLSVASLVGDTVTAMAYLQRVGERVHSSFTGAHPGFRGRGHATLVKSRALHSARAAGATEAFTTNDAKNAPMLAVNTSLGYEPFLERTALRREGAAPGGGVAG